MKIGVFDSGIGGLTVLKELIKYYPNNEYIYFGDTLNLPYGQKKKEQLLILCTRIISFFEEKKVDIIIVACGTVSCNIYSELKKLTSISIINVVDPTIKYLKSIKNKKIGLMATKATVDSHYFSDRINITALACPSLVPIIENNLIESSLEIINEYLNELKNCDVIVLGCTHYPMIKDKIENYFKREIEIVNMGEILAKQVNITNNAESKISIYFSKLDEKIISNTKSIIGNYHIELKKL